MLTMAHGLRHGTWEIRYESISNYKSLLILIKSRFLKGLWIVVRNLDGLFVIPRRIGTFTLTSYYLICKIILTMTRLPTENKPNVWLATWHSRTGIGVRCHVISFIIQYSQIRPKLGVPCCFCSFDSSSNWDYSK